MGVLSALSITALDFGLNIHSAIAGRCHQHILSETLETLTNHHRSYKKYLDLSFIT